MISENPMPSDGRDWLANMVTKAGGVAGTMHVVDGEGLRLVAAVNIPPPVQAIVEYVPRGKGMAGMALDSGEPVQTCNLKEDTSGNVRPGAKAVNAKAAVAMPVRDAGGAIVAVVGVAFDDEREISEQEVRALTRDAESVVSILPPRTR